MVDGLERKSAVKCQYDLVMAGEEGGPYDCDADATHYNCRVDSAKVCEKHRCRCNVRVPAALLETALKG